MIIFGGFGNNTLFGGKDNDTLSGESGNDILRSEDGNDLLDGDAPNPVTGSAKDTLYGGEDNDILSGESGNDILRGEDGNDTFEGSQDKDNIDDGDGFDIANYSKLGKAITLSGVGTITKAGRLGTDQVFKVETVIADAGVANNTIDTSQSLSGVFISADLKAKTISANNVPSLGILTFNVVNFDNVIGTQEADSIKGDEQNNQLVGNDGNDFIIGRQGDDILIGGFGADKFIFNSFKEGLDTIKDYTFGQNDVIEVSKLGFGTTNINDFYYDVFLER
ncbi:calcium-binding protein [Nostoc sp.]|uniref:calcium-binding protein n=1 Tax=Nostoc sp. TaxID=1180 RepID=UPI002FF0241C